MILPLLPPPHGHSRPEQHFRADEPPSAPFLEHQDRGSPKRKPCGCRDLIIGQILIPITQEMDTRRLIGANEIKG